MLIPGTFSTTGRKIFDNPQPLPIQLNNLQNDGNWRRENCLEYGKPLFGAHRVVIINILVTSTMFIVHDCRLKRHLKDVLDYRRMLQIWMRFAGQPPHCGCTILWGLGHHDPVMGIRAVSRRNVFFSKATSWAGWSPPRSCSCRAGSWCTPPCLQAPDMWKPSHLCERWDQSNDTSKDLTYMCTKKVKAYLYASSATLVAILMETSFILSRSG